MADTVSIKIKIDDSGSFKKVDVDAADLRKGIKAIKDETDKLNGSMANLALSSQAAANLNAAISSLQNAFAGLSAGFIEGDTQIARLGQAMRNTMDATQDDVLAIRDLCEAQERLGVTSKESQLAGAQELATYLELPSSLRLLIPVLNDMAAQQLGVGASAESVAQIASMLGKVMNGQTEALSRYGYKFNEAQKYILQFGTEEERAAVLADVVGESVGGMSEAVRNSAEGALFAAETRLSNIGDLVGGLVAKLMPTIQMVASFSTAWAGVIQLKNSFNALNLTLGITKIQSLGLAVAIKANDIAMKIFGVTARSCAGSITAVRVATVALTATFTLGLSVAITALVELFSRLTIMSKDSAAKIKSVSAADQAYRETASRTSAEIARQIVETENLIKKKLSEKEKVAELNEKYGDVFGHYNTLSKWYDVLTTKSMAYCRQLGFQAKAEKLIQENGDNIVALDELQQDMANARREGRATRRGIGLVKDTEGNALGWTVGDIYTADYQSMRERQQSLAKAISDTNDQIRKAQEDSKKAYDEVITEISAGPGKKDPNNNKKNITDDIKEYRESVRHAVEVNDALNDGFGAVTAKTRAMESGLTSLINRYGLERSEVRGLVEEYRQYSKEQSQGLISGILSTPSGLQSVLPSGVSSKKKETLTGADAVSYWQQTDEVRRLDGLSGEKLQIELEAIGLDGLEKRIKSLKSLLDKSGKPLNDRQKEEVEALINSYEGYEAIMAKSNMTVNEGWANVRALGSGIQSLTASLKGNGSAWDKLCSVIDGAFSIFQSLSGIVRIVDTLNKASIATTKAKGEAEVTTAMQTASASVTTVSAKGAEATVNTAAAASGGASAVASIPYVGPALAVAAIASIIAALSNLPRFADGALAFGPALGLFGEYAGAANNPEVVAPLDRIQGLLDFGDDRTATTRFIIRGQDLEAVMNRRSNLRRRI